MRSQTAGVGGVVIVAIVTRILTAIWAWVTNGSGYFTDNTDSLQYMALAASLAAGEGFVCAPDVDFTPPGGCPHAGAAEVFRTPGYPLFLAIGQIVGHPVLVAVALQVVLGAGTAVLVYLIARRVVDSAAVALCAGFLYAIDPLSVLLSTHVMSETLFAAVFAVHLLIVLKHLETDSMRTAAAAGATAALAVFVRPVAFYWPAIVCAVILLRHRRHVAVALATVTVFAVAAFGPVSAWKLRNTHVAGYSGFSSVTEVNLHLWVGASVQAQVSRVAFNDMQNRLQDRLDLLANRHAWTRAEQYQHMELAGVQAVLDAPDAAFVVYARSVLRLLGPTFSEYAEVVFRDYSNPRLIGRILSGTAPPLSSYWFVLPLYAWLIGMCTGAVILGLFGAHAFLRRATLPRAVMLAAGVYFLALMPGAGDGGSDRMRHPAMPAICVLAGAGISQTRIT